MDWEGDRTKILRISVIKTTSATYDDDETNKCLMFICRWEKVIVTENNKGRIFYLDCNFFPMLSSIIRGKPPIITLKQAFKSECNFQLFYLNSEKLILPSLFLSTVLIISSTFILNRFWEKLSKQLSSHLLFWNSSRKIAENKPHHYYYHLS